MNLKVEKLLIILTISISVALLLFSLTKNLFFITGMKESLGSFGLVSFLLGWMNLFGAGICWLANPFLILSWSFLLVGSKKKPLIFALLSFYFSILFLSMKSIIANEGGGHCDIIAYDIGYWLWLSSTSVNLIGNLIIYWRKSIETQ